jgi:hypothetical protein
MDEMAVNLRAYMTSGNAQSLDTFLAVKRRFDSSLPPDPNSGNSADRSVDNTNTGMPARCVGQGLGDNSYVAYKRSLNRAINDRAMARASDDEDSGVAISLDRRASGQRAAIGDGTALQTDAMNHIAHLLNNGRPLHSDTLDTVVNNYMQYADQHSNTGGGIVGGLRYRD